jgi:hypothetical protein
MGASAAGAGAAAGGSKSVPQREQRTFLPGGKGWASWSEARHCALGQVTI